MTNEELNEMLNQVLERYGSADAARFRVLDPSVDYSESKLEIDSWAVMDTVTMIAMPGFESEQAAMEQMATLNLAGPDHPVLVYLAQARAEERSANS
jgi:hypothetical protein